MDLTLSTPIVQLHRHGIANLTATMSKKLAVAVAKFAEKSDPDLATVEDLLAYFPARYEDRSNLTTIDTLYDGLEASVELFVRVSGNGDFTVRGIHRYDLWLDKMTYLPLKAVSDDPGEGLIEEVLMADLEIGLDLPDHLFNL